jgi:uncharacterized protein (TIGR02246 family)
MKTLLTITLAGLAIGISLPTFAQQNGSVDPQTAQQIRALAAKYDEAFNKNDAAAVAALYTDDRVQVFRGTSHGRQGIEKSYAKYDFQRCRFNNRLITVDQLNGVGKDVRAIGRWSDTGHDEPYPTNHGGHFTWIIVREGDTLKIRRDSTTESNP